MSAVLKKGGPAEAVDTRARQIWDRITKHLAGAPFPTLVQGDDVLVALWHGDEKSRGGILYPDEHKDENIYQGKAGLVLALGHLAFTTDETHVWGERTPRVGDWVVFRVGDGWPFALGGREGQHCRILREGAVRMVVGSPDEVY